ncbi:hypothetical protein [Streptomyces sp. NPDC001604]|uniref:hypothetical protein n=1 Tax=Streptomyces sp. NPDC001604 TaxID=3364593 RepID=UPI00368E7FAE
MAGTHPPLVGIQNYQESDEAKHVRGLDRLECGVHSRLVKATVSGGQGPLMGSRALGEKPGHFDEDGNDGCSQHHKDWA